MLFCLRGWKSNISHFVDKKLVVYVTNTRADPSLPNVPGQKIIHPPIHAKVGSSPSAGYLPSHSGRSPTGSGSVPPGQSRSSPSYTGSQKSPVRVALPNDVTGKIVKDSLGQAYIQTPNGQRIQLISKQNFQSTSATSPQSRNIRQYRSPGKKNNDCNDQYRSTIRSIFMLVVWCLCCVCV